jgi:histidinol-phosphate aminotransferase
MNPRRHHPIKPAVAQLQAYDPHKRLGQVKLDANEHPFALPPALREAVLQALTAVSINRYPDPEAAGLRHALAKMLDVTPDMLLLGNGSDELVQMVLMACGTPEERVLTPTPTFSMYGLGARILDQRVVEVPLTADWDLDMPQMLAAIAREQPRVTFLATPNNPTANCFASTAVRQLIEAVPGVIVIDEAYYEFSGQTVLPLLQTYPHLLVFRTLSKIGMAGLRVGILVGHPKLVYEINKVRLPYNLSAYSQAAALVVLQHWERLTPEFRTIIYERERLRESLGRFSGVTVFPSQANFLLARLDVGAARMWEALGEHGILVRHFPESPALQDCLRITVGTPHENTLLATTWQTLVETFQPLIRP